MAVSSTTGGLRTGVCLSTDRPQNPYNGQVVYETDTNRTLVWDNSAWVVVADPALVSFSGTGATVTADAMTVAGENVTPYTGRRNLLYNGAMQVWQRATSGTTTGADNYKTMDRWRNRTGSIGQSMTVSRQSAGLTGFQYCARIQRPSGGTDTGRLNLIQSLETSDVVRFAGQTVTLSFYARKGANFSGASNNLLTYLITGTGTDQYWLNIASGGNPLINGTTWTLTSSWQRFTASVFVPSTEESMFLDFSYDPTGTAGADDYYEITGIQLELGDKATPFEHLSYGEELALCQRYYQRFSNQTNGPGVFASGQFGGGTSTSRCILHFHTQMRVVPTSVDFSAASTFWINGHNIANYTVSAISANTFGGNTPFSLEIGATPSSTAQGTGVPCVLVASNQSAYIGVSAEL